MQDTASLSSGKGHRDENFPVASFLIRRSHRPVILAFYRFARAADDIADHAEAPPAEKLALLGEMRGSLIGERQTSPEAQALGKILVERNLTAQPPLDLLEAFRRDVTKLRYADWDDLMDYCRYSANPVGRFVLDVHGESPTLWPISDALCSALQVINHLQDCAKDYHALNRVYIPLDILQQYGIEPSVLAEKQSPPALRSVLDDLLVRVALLLDQSRPFAAGIVDRRLGLEVAVIQRLAEDLTRRLRHRDPLSERVHHNKSEAARIGLAAATGYFFGRSTKKPSARATRDWHEPAHGS
ncbi:MAG TPA: squalene synthase HpnC [Rhizomicrobium sp.]|jgi:squalene synthase HpnC|nr:squalene synthase HpnC [Rhizomicrobium sp.]